MEKFVKGLAISQLIPKNKFNELIQRWQIDKGVIRLSTEKLLEVLIWSAVFEKRTLRDISNSYGVPKSTLDDALKKRPSEFFQELCFLALKELIALQASRKDRQELREILAIDASVCHVHGSMATQFIATKIEHKTAGIKFHAAWNVENQWVEDFRITAYRRNDGAVGKDFCFSRGKTYVFDRAYVDLKLWKKVEDSGAHFVTRLKKNGFRLKYIHDCHVDRNGLGILYDAQWAPSDTICYRSGVKPKEIFYRHIVYRDPESKKIFDFITSDFESEAIEIANIYRKRWAVELLFRWLKGHLNIRRFAYKNLNAVKVVLAVAILVQLLVRFGMIRENFGGTAWDYLRSYRNVLDQLFYKTLTQTALAANECLESLCLAEAKESS